jgi:RNA polymerase sigma-70 factor (ECF subfamily)
MDSVDELAARREFYALIAPHLPMLHAQARQLCRAHYEPEDLVQDALLSAFRARSHLKDVTRARAWLLTILTHAFIDNIRRIRRRPDTVPLVADEVPALVPDDPPKWDNIKAKDLRVAIDRLTDDVRDTYRMYAVEGRDQATIARAQRIATATVGTRIFRARKQLRVLLMVAPPQEASG